MSDNKIPKGKTCKTCLYFSVCAEWVKFLRNTFKKQPELDIHKPAVSSANKKYCFFVPVLYVNQRKLFKKLKNEKEK